MSTINQLANMVGRMDADDTREAAAMLLAELSTDYVVSVVVAMAKDDEMLADELLAHLEDIAS